jgi:hypothetical protein
MKAARWAAILAGSLALVLACPVAGDETLEAAVKASYLYKLAPFVDWPARAFSGPSDPLNICVVGRDPFGTVLDRAIAGQRSANRPILARRLARAVPDSGCQIMYLGGSPIQSVKEALSVVHGTPVLTVTADSFPAGIIDLTLDRGRVRLRIDDAQAAQGGLAISSKLLGLAISVKPRAGAGPPP